MHAPNQQAIQPATSSAIQQQQVNAGNANAGTGVQGINDISSNDYYYGDVFLHVTTDVSYLSLNNSLITGDKSVSSSA